MPRSSTVLATVLVAVFTAAQSSQAGLIFEAPTVSVGPGDSGSFDVTVFNNNPAGGGSYQVAADSLELFLSGPAGAKFTGVDISTTVPYLFAVSGTTQGGGPFSFSTFPGNSFISSDAEFGLLGYRQIDPGQSFGVSHVNYAVAAGGKSGDLRLNFGGGTSLSDANGNVIATPEPSSCLLLLAGLVAVVIGPYRKTQLGLRNA
jgi:hypothetical protein